MNTTDATPQLSFGDDATLSPWRYPLVNLPIRTTTRDGEKRRQWFLWLTDCYRHTPSPVRRHLARARALESGELSKRPAMNAGKRFDGDRRKQ
jgi:hypothetical protein